MYNSSFTTQGKDGIETFVYVWEPKEVKAIVQIVHGSVEHVLRYDDFATELTKHGYLVYGHDIRGHGKSLRNTSELAYFSDLDNGFDLAIQEVIQIGESIKQEHPNKKLFVFSHSMGTMIVRKLLSETKGYCDGVLLSGTGGGKPLLLNAGIYLAKRSMKKNGRKYRDEKLHDLLYGTLNREIKNPKTSVDFLSYSEENINNYLNDDLCGVTVTAEYIYEMLKGVKYVNSSRGFKDTDTETPIYLFSGQDDPVGGKNGSGVKHIYNKLKKAGVKDVDITLFPNTRHESLNEKNKEEVYNHCIRWIKKHA